MFSLTSRAQAISNKTLLAVSAISVAVAVLSLLQLYFGGAWNIGSTRINNVKAVALLKNLRAFGAEPGTAKENAKLQFDLAADLSPLFNWNTKQLEWNVQPWVGPLVFGETDTESAFKFSAIKNSAGKKSKKARN
ncbi:hypothetical protein HF325_000643 [Metschnikowia pulcherrima]|uniref:Signal peptidase subunit 3 n=1 Tax=Metschnikowia pulcherrima TaxID=27326 RepID=A0A8H7LCL7_9ASCO|nr:hypothetical protein HF325_000643 [Metschnikowia pulcherrima]